jgi:hypothetical protein
MTYVGGEAHDYYRRRNRSSLGTTVAGCRPRRGQLGGGLGFGHPDLLQRAFGFRMLALRHWHPVVRRYDDAQYTLVAVNLGDADQAVPFWFPIAGDYAEELHRGALDLENVPVLQQVWLSIPSHYGRIWTLSSP